MSEDTYTKSLNQLDNALAQNPTEVDRAFIADLREAMLAKVLAPTIQRAPYVDPTFSGELRQEVAFPGYTNLESISFAFLVRPYHAAGSSSTFYGAPTWLSKVVPLSESGLLERKIGTFRVGKGIDPNTDRLIGIITEKMRERLVRANQDLMVDLTLGDLLAAYETEDGCTFDRDKIQVQKVKIVVPTNPAYTTESGGLILPGMGLSCFGYGVGETFYRGRPVVDSIYNLLNSRSVRVPRLVDINTNGEEAYFDIAALSTLRGDDCITDLKVGHFTVISLPLLRPVPPVDFGVTMKGDGYSEARTLGMPTRGGVSKGLDSAAFSVGRATGGRSQLVSGTYDTHRPLSIIDAQVLVLTPSQIPDALVGLPE